MERVRDKETAIERTKSRNNVCKCLVRQINTTHLFTCHRHYDTLIDPVRFEVLSETRMHIV